MKELAGRVEETDQMKPFAAPGATADWKEAHSRVKAFLQAMQVTRRDQQDRILSAVFQRAAVQHAKNPGGCPTALAMHEMHGLLEQWYAKFPTSPAAGVVSWLAVEAARKWPGSFLAGEIPDDLQRALRECDVSGVPSLRISRMVPQPFAHPLKDVIHLQDPLEKLAKDLPASMARAIFELLFWSGNRLR